MDKPSTIPAPPSSPAPTETPRIEVRNGRPVVVKIKAANATPREDPFAVVLRRLSVMKFPASTVPARDLLLVDNASVVVCQRSEIYDTYAPSFKAAGWWQAVEGLLKEIERAPQRRDGNKLAALIFIGQDVKLAWLMVAAPQGGKS
jgi:hypothetical protein